MPPIVVESPKLRREYVFPNESIRLLSIKASQNNWECNYPKFVLQDHMFMPFTAFPMVAPFTHVDGGSIDPFGHPVPAGILVLSPSKSIRKQFYKAENFDKVGSAICMAIRNKLLAIMSESEMEIPYFYYQLAPTWHIAITTALWDAPKFQYMFDKAFPTKQIPIYLTKENLSQISFFYPSSYDSSLGPLLTYTVYSRSDPAILIKQRFGDSSKLSKLLVFLYKKSTCRPILYPLRLDLSSHNVPLISFPTQIQLASLSI